jgi:membrane associated rhomboid family serine protease
VPRVLILPVRDLLPVRSRPVVTYALLGANLAAFLFQFTLDPETGRQLVLRYGVIPHFLTEDFHAGSLSTPLTAMFLHGGWFHLMSNLWFLHIFADNVEDALGRVRFALFYVGCGLAAAAAHVFVDADSRMPMIGASGAISGVLAAYFRLFPGARVVTFIWLLLFFVRELPALLLIALWFVMQLFGGIGSLGHVEEAGGTAFFAHIGGFVAGLLLVGWIGLPRESRADRARAEEAATHHERLP